VKPEEHEASDLCVEAFGDLENRRSVAREEIGCAVVVTQNPDCNIPHVSAIVHSRLGLPEACACFDVGLGCTGYVHGLAIALGFMAGQGIRTGLLFTADPYSKIVDPADKNTSLLFGDAATVTLLGESPAYLAGPYSFGTRSQDGPELACAPGAKLVMNGQAIFNFAARAIPQDLQRLSARAALPLSEIDLFLLHQGSRFIVETIAQRAKLDPAKVPFASADYGNTVSSSIPMMLQKEIAPGGARMVIMSGFGVGLAYASAVLRRAN
jgi:3-oxoacyl-[acyl-carrier-protein] synthase-3